MNTMEKMSVIDKLPIYSIYIHKNGEICKVLKERVILEVMEDDSCFSQKRLIEWVSHRRNLASSMFRLDDILLFHILDTDSVDNEEFMHSYSVLENIELDKSISIFHRLSSLYLFFRETETVIKKPLKILDASPQETIHLNYIDVDPHAKKTRKQYVRLGKGTRKVFPWFYLGRS